MIDHVIIGVRDLAASRSFYERALAPLGIGVALEHPTSGIGFGRGGMPAFWLADRPPGGPVHVAFQAPNRDAIEEP